jgi:hypothetical protein
VLSSPGQPLDAATRTGLEPHFDHDFSQVKASNQSSSLTIRPPCDLYEKEADTMAHKVLQTPDPVTSKMPSPSPFDGVRIHTTPQAAEASHAISADAFTVGNDIVFGAGKYAPQTMAGRSLLAHELTHVAQQQTPARGIQRQPTSSPNGAAGLSPFAASLNYKEIAKAIHEAIDRIGTDEEAVYMALQQLNRDSEAIEQLKKVYRQEYEADLVEDIYGDFSGTEREYALQLLNLGTADSDQQIGTVPTTVEEYKKVAQRLRAAVEGIGTDEEAIYAVLLPFNRQKEMIDKLKLVYEALYEENLRARLSDELSGSEANYALWLLADQPILRDNQQAETDSQVILAYIKTTAQANAKMPPSIDPSSNFYTVLKDDYLKDYFTGPTAAKGTEAARDKIGHQIEESGTMEVDGQMVPAIKPEGQPRRPVVNRWEYMALMWLNRQQIPPQLQNIEGAPILQNLKGLPSQLGAATEVLTKEKWDKLGYIDVPHLLGKPNTSQDFDADVREGGKNISQLMHWATGVRYSDQSLVALRELFLGYEKWHLEGFDVFGQDSLNDMLAEYQGALLGKELRQGSAGTLKTEADLLPFLNRSFLESRAWVGAILKYRTTELDNWILAKQQAAASMHWQKEEDVWHSRTVYQLLADGMSVEDVKKSYMVESAIEIYTLIYESDEWQKANGPVNLSPLEIALVQGKLDTLLKVMAKAEDKKAGTGDYLQAKSALDDLKKMK